MLISILAILLSLAYFLLLGYLRKGWLNLPHFKRGVNAPATRVSIIVAARNEEHKIAATIQDILAQDYPSHLFELIVVDDHSTDRTSGIIQTYEDKGVRLIQLNESQGLNSYKKKAIATAIDQAKGDLIVTTDADCRMGTKWLSTLVSYFESGEFHMVSSPVIYFEEKSFFERLQTLEFLFLIGLGAAGIGNKMPSTCNGANLAYRKKTFYKVGGFKGIDDLASGDDELLLHKISTFFPDGIGFCKSYDALVFTDAKATLGEFIQQRKRWASKSTKYKNRKLIVLAVTIWLFNLSVLVAFIGAVVFKALFFIGLIQLVIKLIAELLFLHPVLAFANRKKLVYMLPLLSLIHILYIIYIGVAGNSGKYIWKDRRVR